MSKGDQSVSRTVLLCRRWRRRRIVIAALVVAVIVLVGSLFYYLDLLVPKERSVVTFTSQVESGRYVKEYSIYPGAYPEGVAVDERGDVWFAIENATALGELSPSNGTVREFPLPEPKSAGMMTWDLAVDNSRQVVWLSDFNSNAVWSFNITSQAFTKFVLPTQGAFPYQLALDASGNVWLTELFKNKIAEITTQGLIREFTIPYSNSTTYSNPETCNSSDGLAPSGILVDNRTGTVWFTETFVCSLASFSNGKFTQYDLSRDVVAPTGIAIDSRGDLWITEHGPSFVSEFNPSTGYLRTISTTVPAKLGSSLPYFVHVDSHDDVWFNEHYGNALAVFSPSENTLVEYNVPTRIASAGNISAILTFALSPAGAPWFAESFSGKIGTIDTQTPLAIDLRGINASGSTLNIANQSSRTIGLSVVVSSGNFSVPEIRLESSVGNFTDLESLNFSFFPSSGAGTFDATVTIRNNGSRPGTYFATMSAESSELAVSDIIQIRVP